MLLAVASNGAYAQKLIDGRLILPQSNKFTIVSAQGEVMFQGSGNEVTGAYLRDGIYIVHLNLSALPWVRISVANFGITGMSYPRKVLPDEDEQEKADTTVTICFFPVVPWVTPSTEVMNRDPRRLRGDYYIYAFIFSGDTVQPYTNDDDDIYFPEFGEYEKPDWNIRLSIGKSWKSKVYAPSVTSFPAADTNSTLAWFKYSFNVATGLHTFIPRDTGMIMSVLVDHVFTRTDSVVITDDGVTRDAILLDDASTETRMVLCRYVPDFVSSCDPGPPEPKPWTKTQFKELIASYGPMANQMDTVLQAMQGVYYTQPFTGNALADHEADIYDVPYDFILNLYANDWGGVCGNYATFYRRTLNELYGIRAWEYSIGILGTNVGGHMFTLVEYIGPSISYVDHTSRDTSYYAKDPDFNCGYADSLGNPMDIRDQFALIAAHRQREIHVTENYEMGTFLQKGPCLRTVGTGIYTPDSYVEEPGTGYLYRHHLVRRIEGLALDPEYVDISMWYENLEAQGHQYRGDFADWPMSVIWFKGLFGGPDYQGMTTKVRGWMEAAGLHQ